MPNVSARVWGQLIAEICPHTSISGEAWQIVKPGTTTAAGLATSIVDTDGDSGTADLYNGRYWVRICSGTYLGLERQILDDDGAGTLTVDAFPGAPGSGIEYEILLSPDPAIVCDGDTASTTQFNDDVRDEADDYWKDFYAIPISGALVGEVSKVTAFVKTGGASEGLFTVSPAFSAAPGTGDVIKLRKFIEVRDLTEGPDQAYHPRPQKRTNFSRGDGTVGARVGTLAFGVDAQCSGSLSASGSLAASTPLGTALLAAGLDETVDTSSTVGAGASASAVAIDTAGWEHHTVGGGVIYNGEFRRIASLDDGGAGVDTVNVTPPFSVIPAATETLYATRMYAPSESGDTYGMLVEIERDGIRTIYTGCKGNVSQGGEDLQVFSFDLQVDHYVRMINAATYRPNAWYPTTAPVRADERIFYLDTTRTNVNGFTSTPGTAVSPKSVQGSAGINGRSGYHVTDYNPGGTFREIVSSSAELTQDLRWMARTAMAILAIYGKHGNLMAVAMPVAKHIAPPHPEEMDGMIGVPDTLEAQDAATATDGTPTVQKIPDLSYYIA